MADHDMARLDRVPRKTISMGSEALSLTGEGLRKPLADDYKRPIGQAIERAIALAGMTKQQVAAEMGYENQAALSRWISGIETPQFAKLFAVKDLRAALVIALAEMAKDIDITTTISIRRAG